ncbi:MAG: hypothetical protein WAL90_11235 [Desulfobacterales bacterium]
MDMHLIEIDPDVWNHLKQFAEPFVDTPNSVLRRLLLDEDDREDGAALSVIDIKGVPKALSQIFEVLYEIEVNGCSRVEATHKVAEKRGTAPQTVIDKYCRQLNKRAHEIDQLFDEKGYAQFKKLLKQKFTGHSSIIDLYFDTLTGNLSTVAADDPTEDAPEPCDADPIEPDSLPAHAN